jgi:hypothetical protein
MKKAFLVAAILSFLMGGAGADVVVNGVDPGATWYGYMNVFDLGMNYQWGSAWGTADLRAGFAGDTLVLQSNTNCWNPADPYWVNPDGTPNKIMEGNFYQEWFGGLAGQTVTFNYLVLSNDLAAEGYSTKAFIKVLDPDSGWATINSVFADLVPGLNTLTLTVNSIATPVTQVGFAILGPVSDPAGSIASKSVVVSTVPEPATLALLGLGGLLMCRKK